jgi:hypothetical protein
MALDRTQIVRMAGGNGMNLWLYKTNDLSATVVAGGYFSPMYRDMGVGDFLFCSVAQGGTPARTILAVTSINMSTGAVTVSVVV